MQVLRHGRLEGGAARRSTLARALARSISYGSALDIGARLGQGRLNATLGLATSLP
jgi:hypothetical protein